MRVYLLRPDVNHYQYFMPEKEEDWDKFHMACVPKAEGWSPPPVFIYQPFLKKGDFYNFNSGYLITSPRATEVLRTFLEMAGELLPLSYRGEIYTVLNVTECINCLDHSKVEWRIKGETPEESSGIRRYAFHSNRFSESRLFKIPETHTSEIYAVEWAEDSEQEVKHAVEQADLQGLRFDRVWEG